MSSELIRQLPTLAPRTLHTVEFAADYPGPEPEKVTDLADANLISSIDPGTEPGMFAEHRPVLDLDVPAFLVPSSTPGHSHLYLDVKMDDATFWRLLEALADAGVLEPGYVRACKSRGYTSVRLPWIKKAEATA